MGRTDRCQSLVRPVLDVIPAAPAVLVKRAVGVIPAPVIITKAEWLDLPDADRARLKERLRTTLFLWSNTWVAERVPSLIPTSTDCVAYSLNVQVEMALFRVIAQPRNVGFRDREQSTNGSRRHNRTFSGAASIGRNVPRSDFASGSSRPGTVVQISQCERLLLTKTVGGAFRSG